MGSETDPVLVRIQAKIDAWQAAADSYRAALALEQSSDGAGASAGDVGRVRSAIELPVGAFRGMTIADAIKLYLRSVRRKQTPQEIADGLRAGGLESTAKDFGPTLRSTLHSLKKKGHLLRFKDGWDLADAHSTSLRNRITKEAAKPAKKKLAKKANGQKAAKAKPVKPAGPKGPSLDERVQAFLATKPLEWFTVQQIADGLKEPNTKSMGLAFARLVRYGRIAKQDDGRYVAIRK